MFKTEYILVIIIPSLLHRAHCYPSSWNAKLQTRSFSWLTRCPNPGSTSFKFTREKSLKHAAEWRSRWWQTFWSTSSSTAAATISPLACRPAGRPALPRPPSWTPVGHLWWRSFSSEAQVSTARTPFRYTKRRCHCN